MTHRSTGRTRVPLADLPVVNFVTRPTSPVKSSSTSPTKATSSTKAAGSSPALSPMHATIIAAAECKAPSASRSSSLGSLNSSDSSNANEERGKVSGEGEGDTVPAADALRSFGRQKSGSPSELCNIPLEESPSIPQKQHTMAKHAVPSMRARQRPPHPGASPSRAATKAALAERVRRQQAQPSSSLTEIQNQTDALITPPMNAQQASSFASDEGRSGGGSSMSNNVPQSLPRKKNRVRASEVARFSAHGDGDDDCESFVSALSTASPSPVKIRKGMMMGSPDHASGTQPDFQQSAFGLGISSPSTTKEASRWTVYVDEDNISASELEEKHTGPVEIRGEEDKENSRPDPIVLQGRRKGTGGRLSLVAQNVGDTSSCAEEKSHANSSVKGAESTIDSTNVQGHVQL